MALNTDKNSYTIIFSIVMVVVVGSLLAFVAQVSKPTIKENQRIEIQQNILYAMGVNNNDDGSMEFVPAKDAGKEFSKYITKQLVIQNGEVSEDDQAYLIDLKKEKNLAKDPGYSRRLPLFVGEKDGKTFYIAPVSGKGLWDAIWGYVAMDENMVVQGVFFDHKGETPGLGANIKARFFMDDFTGEHLLNDSGDFKSIAVAKGNADPKNENKTDNEVDAIAGATITGNGVTAMLKSDLKLYVPYFKNLNN
ncbi:MAG TPA: Na(+)-translocating NADH-quinone reductase subunit C [Flavobacteriaceae bacterium]|nr:Na(+)-translocating NADH-quinone reductase subunit C [Flavobacteriaceae bacterium]MCB9213136.1 Na(+)-translocating NADH-quinone reductase subunit C [Alteromonas sp.]HPF11042.1 Na(+)-translocating NADH-quinone reductase subunit C [Flavobacteriaceae bacterium]HQU21859.1 Na(+)-translocating NADH-quinone reductase subunit C [Flavobacteriaceae bacterium]HQU64109.1 Na(+)-translocating NADH-quinone reductase subunit C [Flavobacteriaceae bacterium]